MDAITAVAETTEAGARLAPLGHILHHFDAIPMVSPVLNTITVRNAEGTVQAGKTALKVLKGAGVTLAAGAVFGSGLVLFAAGAAGAIAGPLYLANFIKDKMDKRHDRIEKEKLAAAMPMPA